MDMTTWQESLESYYSKLSAKGKAQFHQAVDADRTTVLRWRRSENVPRAESIQAMLSYLPPETSEQLRTLMLEDPKIALYVPNTPSPSGFYPIPSRIYFTVLSASKTGLNRFRVVSQL